MFVEDAKYTGFSALRKPIPAGWSIKAERDNFREESEETERQSSNVSGVGETGQRSTRRSKNKLCKVDSLSSLHLVNRKIISSYIVSLHLHLQSIDRNISHHPKAMSFSSTKSHFKRVIVVLSVIVTLTHRLKYQPSCKGDAVTDNLQQKITKWATVVCSTIVTFKITRDYQILICITGQIKRRNTSL